MQQPQTTSPSLLRDPTILTLLVIAGMAVIGLAIHGPIPQNPGYHQFVDSRRIWGIPRFGDVMTNLGFILVGAWAIGYLIRSSRGSAPQRTSDRLPYWFFFAGLLLTGFGSAYYHWDPTNARLTWDRLPLTVSFMALFCAVISERISRPVAMRLFAPLMLLGAASVIYWAWAESRGQGDLRAYAFVQFYPMVAIPIILLRFKSRYTDGHYLWWALGWYAAAKICEHSDGLIYELLHVVSGHNLKHILATGAPLTILLMLKHRQLRSG